MPVKMISKLISPLLVALSFIVAFCLRTCLPYDKIFRGEWIKYAGADAYYHMRIVDNLVHNFPQLMSFDPYLIYPGGAGVGNIRFFDWLLASIIWVVGLGSPTEHTIDMVGVYFPAVLGALTVIPVYFIGKELFGRWAGILSAGLLAILPGEFLGRSILGFTDHHAAEVLFTTVTILFLILAIKAAKEKNLTFSHLRHRDWPVIAKPIIYSLLAGIFLGMYILTFLGWLLFVFIIFLYLVIQFVIDYWKQKSTDYLGFIGFGLFLVPLIVYLLVPQGQLYLLSVLIALLVPLILSGISWLMARRKLKLVYYLLTIVGLGLLGLGLVYVINPSLPGSMLSAFEIFVPTITSMTTIEMQPILFPGGAFSLKAFWGNFTTGSFLGIISLVILAYLVCKNGRAERSLLVVWSVIILAAVLGQRRFAYYFAVNVALLTGYISWAVLRFVGIGDSETKTVARPQKSTGRGVRPKNSGFRVTVSHINMALAVVIAITVVYLPNFVPLVPNMATVIDTASAARYAPSDAWVASLTWLRENSPEPFGDPDYYYHLETRKYQTLSALMRKYPDSSGDFDFYRQVEGSYPYPDSAYGVLAWWDYGYWITRIAHRIPNANPSQDPRAQTSVASFFTAQDESSAGKDESSAGKIVEELGSSYIVIDSETAITLFMDGAIVGKFWAIATWAGERSDKYFDIYYIRQGEYLVPNLLYHPEYYRSMAIRLYNFDCQPVTPEKTTVISYEEKLSHEGTPYKEITGAKNFDSYEEAEAFISGQESGNYKVIGTSPLVSPVPLEALNNYQLVYSSDNLAILPGEKTIAQVKIFEYTGD